jgi:hypothetical protein
MAVLEMIAETLAAASSGAVGSVNTTATKE